PARCRGVWPQIQHRPLGIGGRVRPAQPRLADARLLADRVSAVITYESRSALANAPSARVGLSARAELARARYEHLAAGAAERAEASAHGVRAGLGGMDHDRGRSGGVPTRLCRCSIAR